MSKHGEKENVDKSIHDLESYIKVFYNVVEAMNPDIMRLMEEMNKTYVVSEEELKVSLRNHLKLIIMFRMLRKC